MLGDLLTEYLDARDHVRNAKAKRDYRGGWARDHAIAGACARLQAAQEALNAFSVTVTGTRPIVTVSAPK